MARLLDEVLERAQRPKPRKLTVEYPEGRGKHPLVRKTSEMFSEGPTTDQGETYRTHIQVHDEREAADATRVRRHDVRDPATGRFTVAGIVRVRGGKVVR